jgi:hypothetical protein
MPASLEAAPIVRASRLSIDSDAAEAARGRVMRLGSLIKAVSSDEIAVTHSNVLETLLDHQHLGEDRLVIVGLKYLHREIGLSREASVQARTRSSEATL